MQAPDPHDGIHTAVVHGPSSPKHASRSAARRRQPEQAMPPQPAAGFLTTGHDTPYADLCS